MPLTAMLQAKYSTHITDITEIVQKRRPTFLFNMVDFLTITAFKVQLVSQLHMCKGRDTQQMKKTSKISKYSKLTYIHNHNRNNRTI